MWKKLAAMIAGSVLVSSCQTPMYKPVICEPGTALKDGRCQKVPRIIKRPTPVRPATAAPKSNIVAPAWTQPSTPTKPSPAATPKQNEYGVVQ